MSSTPKLAESIAMGPVYKRVDIDLDQEPELGFSYEAQAAIPQLQEFVRS